MIKATDFEAAILEAGAMQIEEFTARNGETGNCKLELGNEFMEAYPELGSEIARALAAKIEPFEPKLIVPIPRGANKLGELVARELGVCYIALGKPNRRDMVVRTLDRRSVANCAAIVAVDDVRRTDSSFEDLSAMPEFDGRIVAAGVIWDRTPLEHQSNLSFDVVSVVKKYVPMRVEQ